MSGTRDRLLAALAVLGVIALVVFAVTRGGDDPAPGEPGAPSGSGGELPAAPATPSDPPAALAEDSLLRRVNFEQALEDIRAALQPSELTYLAVSSARVDAEAVRDGELQRVERPFTGDLVSDPPEDAPGFYVPIAFGDIDPGAPQRIAEQVGALRELTFTADRRWLIYDRTGRALSSDAAGENVVEDPRAPTP